MDDAQKHVKRKEVQCLSIRTQCLDCLYVLLQPTMFREILNKDNWMNICVCQYVVDLYIFHNLPFKYPKLLPPVLHFVNLL